MARELAAGGNEITAAREFLELLERRGSLVTTDVIDCRARTADRARARGGDAGSGRGEGMGMEIRRLSLREGAEAARGLAVIIDVFRAFTCAPLMLHLGAGRLILESDIDACLAWRGRALLVGERDEEPIAGFDLTNSPWQILAAGRAAFAGRTVVHRTTSGVTGALIAAANGAEVLLASFANARATAQTVARQRPAVVSLVAMGVRSRARAPEDERCAERIAAHLTGAPFDRLGALAEIVAHETAQKFLRGDKPYLPREDPLLCLQDDLFDFALRLVRRDGVAEAVPVRP